MPGDERSLGLRQLAVDYVQIGAADGAGMDMDQQLAWAGMWCDDRRCAAVYRDCREPWLAWLLFIQSGDENQLDQEYATL